MRVRIILITRKPARHATSRSQSPSITRYIPQRVTRRRTTKLPRMRISGFPEHAILRTVSHNPPKVEKTERQSRQDRQRNLHSKGIHKHISPFIRGLLQSLLETWLTQYQAFRHPQMRPPNSNIKVQENLPCHRPSIQMPRATPSRVGTTTDQPTMPKMLRPNSRLWSRCRRAFIRRVSFSATDFSISVCDSAFSRCS